MATAGCDGNPDGPGPVTPPMRLPPPRVRARLRPTDPVAELVTAVAAIGLLFAVAVLAVAWS